MILLAQLYLVAALLTSIVSLVLFGWDKRQAMQSGDSRVPERILWLTALLGGWPGALLGQQLFRHKTVKFSFKLMLWLIIAFHIALIFAWLYFFGREQGIFTGSLEI